MLYVFFVFMAIVWGGIIRKCDAGMRLILQVGWILVWIIYLARFRNS